LDAFLATKGDEVSKEAEVAVDDGGLSVEDRAGIAPTQPFDVDSGDDDVGDGARSKRQRLYNRSASAKARAGQQARGGLVDTESESSEEEEEPEEEEASALLDSLTTQ